jgi:hypothetical protein
VLSNLSILSVTWWRLFQKRDVRTKFDIYAFINKLSCYMKYFSAEKLYSDDLRTNTEMQKIQKINRVIQKMIYIIYLDKTKINGRI